MPDRPADHSPTCGTYPGGGICTCGAGTNQAGPPADPGLDADFATLRRGLIAARDFLNRLPLNDGASKQAIDREFVGVKLVPEGLLAADRVEAELARLTARRSRYAEARYENCMEALSAAEAELSRLREQAEKWEREFVDADDKLEAAEALADRNDELARRAEAKRLSAEQRAVAAEERCARLQQALKERHRWLADALSRNQIVHETDRARARAFVADWEALAGPDKKDER